jgi:uncharacterized protein
MSKEFEIPKVVSCTKNAFQPSGQCDCDCDCACSHFAGLEYNNGNNAFSIMLTDPYSFYCSGSYALSLDNTHLICYGVRHTPVILNHSASIILSLFDPSHNLNHIPDTWYEAWSDEVIQSTLKQMITLGLLVPEGYTFSTFTESSTTLTAWLHVTNACNLRCSYCYLDPTSEEMAPQVGRQAVEAVFRSALVHDFPAVRLKYAGGEPTLRFPLVVELHRHAIDLAKRQGLKLDGVVLSNGVGIRPQMIEAIQSLGLRLAISLDGLGPYHDCQRHFNDGQGSFEVVACTIDRALSAGLFPDISITVSGRNADGLPELMAWVLERDLPFSLNFYRENDQSASQTDLRLEEERIIQGMLAAYSVIEKKMPERCLLASLADRANLAAPHLRTCSVGHSYLVIDHQGRVAKCQMDMANTVTTIYDPDPLANVRESSVGIRNLSVEDKAECRDCQWRYWCAGGCPLQAYRATGRYNAKSPNCAIYRALYPEVIRLEGLRLLKYADEP